MQSPEELNKRRSRLTPEQQALLARRLRGTEGAQGADAIPARGAAERLPLSHGQRGLWLTWALDPDSAAYNIAGLLYLRGKLDAVALQQSLSDLVNRHEILRTVFVQGNDGEAEQVIQPSSAFAVDHVALIGAPADKVHDEAGRTVESIAQKPFRLDKEIPFRASLLKLSGDEHWLQLTLHHIAVDGWSLQILVQELIALYGAQLHARPSGLPALQIQFADYALWQHRRLADGELARQLDYWRRQLSTHPDVIELPLDRPRTVRTEEHSSATHAGDHVLTLSARTSEKLRALARREQTTLYVVMLALFKLLLSRVTGQKDLCVGSPVSNRDRLETQGLVGYLLNVLVIRSQVDATRDFSSLLAQVKQTLIDAQRHAEVSFDTLVETLQPERHPGVHPLFQVKCTEQHDVRFAQPAGDLNITLEKLRDGPAHFELCLDFTDRPGGIECRWVYDQDVLDRESVQHWAGVFASLAEQLEDGPACPLAELRLPGPCSDLEGPALPELPADIMSLWQEAVRSYPARVAIRDERSSYRYAELAAQVEHLAGKLAARGVRPEVRVALLAPRSCEFALGVLAILRAGGAYVPLDPQLPVERLSVQCEDSGASLLLSTESPAWETSLPILPLAFSDKLDATDTEMLVRPVHPEQAAYLIYTSGSTGRPKAVTVSRGALANYVQGLLAELDLPEIARNMAMVSTVAADLGNTSFFGTLASGRTLHLVAPDRVFDPDRFAQYMREHEVDVLKIVPSHLQALMQAADPADVLPSHALLVGGEASNWQMVERIRHLKPACRIINHYGPTETTVGVLTQDAEAASRAGTSLPLGRPLANVRALVLDAELNLAPRGTPGELYLGGPELARGYHRRAGLSAERFVPHPWEKGQRLYRSGDRVRQLKDGSIEFLGRVDDQLKIRGYRVEPGEVREQLLQLAGIKEAAVLADKEAERIRLVAYVVCTSDAVIDASAIKEQLGRTLPDYMVPSAVMMLDRLPLNANGKIDRYALPCPQQEPGPEFEPLQGDAEEAVAAVWQEVLGIERVGRHDNFFELGGDSILSLKMVARAKRAGWKISPRQVFDRQTVAALAAVAEPLSGKKTELSDVPKGAVPLLPAQSDFFLCDIPARHHWNQSLRLKARVALKEQLLRTALEALVQHHDSLRLRYRRTADGLWEQSYSLAQENGAERLLWVRHVGDEAAARLCCDEAQRSLNLEQGPLLRAVLLQFPDGRQSLLLVIHHLAVDGISWRVLLEDMQQAYGQARDGVTVRLPEKTASYLAWASALAIYPARHADEIHYWKTLTGAPVSLPVEEAAIPKSDDRDTTVTIRLDASRTYALLKKVPAAYRTQVKDVLLTALGRALCAWSGHERIQIDLEGHGREDVLGVDISRSVGWFTSVFPVVLAAHGAAPEALKRIKEGLRHIPHNGLGYGVFKHFGTQEQKAAIAGLPQSQVCFNYLGQFDDSFDAESMWQGASDDTGRSTDPGAKMAYALAINGRVQGGELSLQLAYDPARFGRRKIETFARSLEQELIALITHCTSGASGATPSDFPLARLEQEQLDRLPLDIANVGDLYPLTPMQQGMLFHSLYDPQGNAYLNQLRLDIDGLDLHRFQAAWQAALQRHEVLRTGFLTKMAQPLQWVARQLHLPLTEHDWRHVSDPAAELDRLAADELARGFDLARPPLMRLVLVRTSERTRHLIWTRHHLLLDGWSTAQLLAEVLRYYAGQPLPATGIRYRDYIGWLQRQDQGVAETWWRQQLAKLDAPTRLSDALPSTEDPSGTTYRTYKTVLDGQETARLIEHARHQRITLNTLIQGAWALLLARYTGQRTVVFGATVAGRPAELAGAEHMLGLFINTLPVIVRLPAEQSADAWLRDLQDQNLGSREHEHIPLYDIQKWAGQGGQTLFDSLLVFENYPVDQALRQMPPGGLAFGAMDDIGHTNYPLTLVIQQGDTLTLQYNALARNFSETCLRSIATHLCTILHALIDHPGHKLCDIHLLDVAQQRQLDDWGRNQEFNLESLPVHHQIERQAAQAPDAGALIFGEEELSYRELNAYANRIAHHLIALGAGPETKVGIAVERSMDMVVGLLGILKSGAAYVPLDPDYPQERLDYMVEDSGIALVLTQRAVKHKLPASLHRIELDTLDLWDQPDHNPDVPLHADSLAYVIYTSGSTGKPKGVGVNHGPLGMHVQAIGHAYGMTAQDRELQFASISFDGAHERTWVPLAFGAALMPRDNQLWTVEQTCAVMQRHRITLTCLTPSYLHQLAELMGEKGHIPSLRSCTVGGEAMSRSTHELVRKTVKPPRLINGYGPTETVITPMLAKLEGDTTFDSAYMPIGRLIGDRTAWVLDADLNLLPPGIAGELYLGGSGLARGYLNRPGLSAERFIADPFDTQGGRLYRTGDLVRWRTDGQLEYLGRIDHQVKVRGFRIELGEIEAQLLAQEDVKEAIVTVQQQGATARLVAHVAGMPGSTLSAGDLKERLKQVLPDYMVPHAIVMLERLPLMGNGKVDRQALPQAAYGSEQAYEAPQGEVEQALADIWARVLEVERVGRHDNFFELGGHSLLAVQMVAHAQNELGAQVTIAEVFQNPTLASLATRIALTRTSANDENFSELDAFIDSLEVNQ